MISIVSKLTRYSDEHLHSVSVSMKTELRVSHAAIRYETSRCDASFRRKNPDANSRRIAFIVTCLHSGYRHRTTRTCSNTVLQWVVKYRYRCHAAFLLTFWQRYRDYHSVTSTNPQSIRRNKQSSNAHEGESKFSRTEHLANIRLYVDILEMLVGMSMIES